MRKFVVILLFIGLFSCKSREQKNKETIIQIVKTHIIDHSFKNNGKVEFHEFQLLGIDTTTENHFDTLRLLNNQDFHDNYIEESKRLEKKMNKDMQTLRLYAAANFKDLFNYQKAEMDSDIEKMRSFADSVQKYHDRDSLIRQELAERQTPKTVFRTRFLIKAVEFRDDKSHNFLDTMVYFIDDKIKSVIDVPKILSR